MLLDSMKLLLLLLSFVSFIRTGHIFSQPSLLLPQNARLASTFHLFFSLESSLSASDFLIIKFPFNLGQATAFITNNVDPEVSNLAAFSGRSFSFYQLFS